MTLFSRADGTMDNYDVWRKDGQMLTHVLFGATPQTAANYNHFFIARYPIEVMRVSEVHSVAGTDAGAVTLDIEKLTGTQASGAGSTVLTSTFDLKSTANTVVTKEGRQLTSSTQGRIIRENERLGLVLSGTPTSIEDLVVCIYYKFPARGDYR